MTSSPLRWHLSNAPGVLIKAVAAALDIHSFMLSPLRKEVREGVTVEKKLPADPEIAAELKRLRELEKQHKSVQMEHELLKSHPVLFRARSPPRGLGVTQAHNAAAQGR